MATDPKSLTLRDVLERAGQALAARDGLAPAAGVQKAYDLTLPELETLDILGLARASAGEATQPLADPDQQKQAAEAAQQLGLGSGPAEPSTAAAAKPQE